MTFSLLRADGTVERRRHIPYAVIRVGQVFEARRKSDGSLLGRSYVSEKSLRDDCDSMTEPA